MLHYYVAQILKNFWPGGALAAAGPLRSEEQRLETAQKAQQMLINNVPEILSTLVGSTAAKNGAKKVFDALQEKNMNKQLFYVSIFITVFDWHLLTLFYTKRVNRNSGYIKQYNPKTFALVH